MPPSTSRVDVEYPQYGGDFVMPTLEAPECPEGYERTATGLYAPEFTDQPSSELVTLSREDADKYHTLSVPALDKSRDMMIPWLYSTGSAFNRMLSGSGLSNLRQCFGDMFQYIRLDDEVDNRANVKNILELLSYGHFKGDKDQIQQEMDVFVGKVNQSAPAEVLKRRDLWSYLSLMSDYFLIENNCKDLRMTDNVLELICKTLDNGGPVTDELLNFISNYDVPSEVAGKLLDRMGERPNHPIFWWMVSRCPDHKIVREQREFVKEMLQPEDGSDISRFNPVAVDNLLPLGVLLDGEQKFPRTGLELETTVFVGLVKVPDGTLMGVDATYHERDILELRLDDARDEGVLEYGVDWLKRYFEVWRWSRVARCINTSIHLHSEDKNRQRISQARQRFGSDEDDCRYNEELGTVEVRTALEGMEKQDSAVPFPPPSFIELIHFCDNKLLSGMLMTRIDEARYDSRLAPDDSERQSQTINTILAILASEDPYYITKLIPVFDKLTSRQQDEAISVILASEDPYCITKLIPIFDKLTSEKQDKAISVILASEDPYCITKLIPIFDKLTSGQQDEAIETILASKYPEYITKLIPIFDKLTSGQQDEAIETILASKYPEYIASLIPILESHERLRGLLGPQGFLGPLLCNMSVSVGDASKRQNPIYYQIDRI